MQHTPDKSFLVDNFADFSDVRVKKKMISSSRWWRLELATSAVASLNPGVNREL